MSKGMGVPWSGVVEQGAGDQKRPGLSSARTSLPLTRRMRSLGLGAGASGAGADSTGRGLVGLGAAASGAAGGGEVRLGALVLGALPEREDRGVSSVSMSLG